ncbi:MAG TPA: hypothetical protein GXZ90_04510 [Clostridiales bacterium]|nr:hypothetical protein [Clostridiales bacterium]
MNNKDKNPKKDKLKKIKRTKAKRVKFNPVQGSSRKNLILVSLAVMFVIILSATIFMTLTSLFSTESYYVLSTNVRAKQQITPDMVMARETAAGTGPVNALSMEQIQRGGVYSRYPMYAGDVISRSNVGALSGQSLGIPDDWVVTSFSTVSTDAVGGILGKGDYIDILGVDESGSRYVFNNLLVLEVKFVNEEYDGISDGRTIVGEAMHYTVGMPADKAAYLHSALYDYEEIKIIKAPTIINYADRDVSNLDASFKYGPQVGNIDLIQGTDPTFTDVERDEDGRPIVNNVNLEQIEDNFVEEQIEDKFVEEQIEDETIEDETAEDLEDQIIESENVMENDDN